MKETKIVFVNPPISIKERYGVTHRSGGETPPLGLAWLAAVCREKGYECEIVDASALGLDIDGVLKKINHASPEYVGLTAVNITFSKVAKISAAIKESRKDIKIIIGGPHFTSLPIKSMELVPHFDVGVIGEGEETIIELLNALEAKDNLENVKGLAIRKDNSVYLTPTRPFIKKLDQLPFPAWNLLPDLAKYYSPPVHTLKKFPAALLVTSRGCPSQCTFCDRSVFGNAYRTFSADYVFSMIRYLYDRYQIREIQFRDDNLVVNKRFLKELCLKLKEAKLDLCWSCVGRVDMVTPSLLKMMKRGGCWSISYGIESGSQEILDVIKKKITIKQIKDAVRWTKENGINCVGFFMAGHPKEDKDSMAQTLRLIKELPLDEFHMTFFTPHPGTEVYSVIERYGKFQEDWDNMTEWNPVFIPEGLTKEDLVKYSKKALLVFYMRPRIMLSYIKKIKSWKHLKTYFSGFLSYLEWLFTKRF